MTRSVSTASLSLADFTAYELPTKKWIGLIRPRMRLRVRTQNGGVFVSSTVKVTADDEGTSVCWPWYHDAPFPRPFFADDDVFEVEVERRFLFRYRCIRRTKPTTIDQVRTGDDCALPLYDGQLSAEMLEDRIVIGEITFTLQSDAGCEDASYKGTASSSMYSYEKLGLHREQSQRRRGASSRV